MIVDHGLRTGLLILALVGLSAKTLKMVLFEFLNSMVHVQVMHYHRNNHSQAVVERPAT